MAPSDASGAQAIRGGDALSAGFRQLLGDPEQLLPLAHFRPDRRRRNAQRLPQDNQVIEQVGALGDHADTPAIVALDDRPCLASLAPYPLPAETTGAIGMTP